MSDTPRPAERLAALSAIAAGLDALIAEAKADVLAEAAAHGVKAFATPFGAVNVTAKDPTIVVGDEDAFLAYVKARHPDAVEVVETVLPTTRRAILDRLAYITAADAIIDTETAEVMEWAVRTAPGMPYTSWPTSAAQKAAKAAASDAVRAGIAPVVEGVRGLLP